MKTNYTAEQLNAVNTIVLKFTELSMSKLLKQDVFAVLGSFSSYIVVLMVDIMREMRKASVPREFYGTIIYSVMGATLRNLLEEQNEKLGLGTEEFQGDMKTATEKYTKGEEPYHPSRN